MACAVRLRAIAVFPFSHRAACTSRVPQTKFVVPDAAGNTAINGDPTEESEMKEEEPKEEEEEKELKEEAEEDFEREDASTLFQNASNPFNKFDINFGPPAPELWSPATPIKNNIEEESEEIEGQEPGSLCNVGTLSDYELGDGQPLTDSPNLKNVTPLPSRPASPNFSEAERAEEANDLLGDPDLSAACEQEEAAREAAAREAAARLEAAREDVVDDDNVDGSVPKVILKGPAPPAPSNGKLPGPPLQVDDSDSEDEVPLSTKAAAMATRLRTQALKPAAKGVASSGVSAESKKSIKTSGTGTVNKNAKPPPAPVKKQQVKREVSLPATRVARRAAPILNID